MSAHACHVWTVLCRRSQIDPESQRLTLLDIVEEIVGKDVSAPEGVDFLPLDAELVSLWSRVELEQPARVEGRIRLFTPRGQPIGKIPFDVDLGEKHRVYQRMRFHLFPYEGAGLYWFHVEVSEGSDWKSVIRVPLEITTDAVAKTQI